MRNRWGRAQDVRLEVSVKNVEGGDISQVTILKDQASLTDISGLASNDNGYGYDAEELMEISNPIRIQFSCNGTKEQPIVMEGFDKIKKYIGVTINSPNYEDMIDDDETKAYTELNYVNMVLNCGRGSTDYSL